MRIQIVRVDVGEPLSRILIDQNELILAITVQ